MFYTLKSWVKKILSAYLFSIKRPFCNLLVRDHAHLHVTFQLTMSFILHAIPKRGSVPPSCPPGIL